MCKKPERNIRLATPPLDDEPGVLTITMGRKSQSYFVEPMPSHFGRAFTLTKIGVPQDGGYDVNVSKQPADSSCECLGHLRHGHCKHVDGLRALLDAGRLD